MEHHGPKGDGGRQQNIQRRRPRPLSTTQQESSSSSSSNNDGTDANELVWTPSGANLTINMPPSFPIAAVPAPPTNIDMSWLFAHSPLHAPFPTLPPGAPPPRPSSEPPPGAHQLLIPLPPEDADRHLSQALPARSTSGNSSGSRQRDMLDTVDHDWFQNVEPHVRVAAERASAGPAGEEALLSMTDANWFMSALERSNFARLPQDVRAQLEASGLRAQAKHRTAVVFAEDVHFVVERQHSFAIDLTDPDCAREPQKWIVHKLCRELAAAFPQSLQMRSGRACIWSAMLARALHHLERSGFSQARIGDRGAQTAREATLFVGEHHISRSNFTKIFKRYLPTHED